MKLALRDGSRVCIIGGGPSGSLAALHLLRFAGDAGLSLDVKIFEPRDFGRRGPAGCNGCAGILSSRLLAGLDELGVGLPPQVIRSYIRGYEVYLDGESLPIEAPNPASEIVSVYRGGGPRLASDGSGTSFDGFLLAAACDRGARHRPLRVRQVRWEDKPVVYAGSDVVQADLIVLATGVNARPPLSPQFGYRPPRTATMAQDEFERPPDWPNDVVRAYFREPRGLVFGALIPKGEHLNISLLGRGLRADAVRDFLEVQGLDRSFPSAERSLCGCTPRIAVLPARSYFGDRWVAVGDAAVTRLYKDGIGSAFATSRAAMQAAVTHGIEKRDFQRFYGPACRAISRDNRSGRWLFGLWTVALAHPGIVRAWKAVLRQESREKSRPLTHTRILWGILTGDEPYATLLRLLLTPGNLAAIWRASRRTGHD
jgi:flavin-dependent dehydrogenase